MGPQLPCTVRWARDPCPAPAPKRSCLERRREVFPWMRSCTWQGQSQGQRPGGQLGRLPPHPGEALTPQKRQTHSVQHSSTHRTDKKTHKKQKSPSIMPSGQDSPMSPRPHHTWQGDEPLLGPRRSPPYQDREQSGRTELLFMKKGGFTLNGKSVYAKNTNVCLYTC